MPGLERILFVPSVLANPQRMSRQNRLLRRLTIALVLLIAVSNLAALVLLIRSLVTGQATAGGQLLGAPGRCGLPMCWSSPSCSGNSAADFRFPQDEDHDAIPDIAQHSSVKPGWAPGFIDYFYVSVTNSSAFSPTDTMPLSARAKLLIAVGSISALTLPLPVLVVSFGAGLLKH